MNAQKFNPGDYRVDRCDKCGRLDAVKRHARRRHCPSCRLYAESERASAKAKQLADLADRAYLAQRMLVHAIEDARIAENNAAIAARDAGVVEAPRMLGTIVPIAVRVDVEASDCADVIRNVTIGNVTCDAPPPCFKLRRNILARTAVAQAYAAMLSIGVGATPARYNWTLLRRAFGSGDVRRKGGRLSGAGGYPWRTERVAVRVAGGDLRCASTQTEVHPCV